MSARRGGDRPQRARVRNRRLILDVVHEMGSITRSQLGLIANLSKSSVKEICDDLLTEGLLEEFQAPSAAPRQGRPAFSLRIGRSQGRVLGIDIGADKVAARLAELGGEEVATVEIRTRREEPDSQFVLGLVDRAVTDVLQRADWPRHQLLEVVVSTPGIVDPGSGVIRLAPQIHGWDGMNLRRSVADTLGFDPAFVHVVRQLDLAAIAESTSGAAEGAPNALFLHLGIGIGAAVLMDGQRYSGAAGAAGEIGYLPHDFGEVAPPGVGAWEWAAGGRAWARHGRIAAQGPAGEQLRDLAGGDLDDIDAAVIVRAAAMGDTAATEVFDRLTHRLAIGIASAVCVLDPSRVIVAGGLSNAGDLLVDALRTELRRLVPILPEVRLATYGGDGSLVGAVHHASTLALDALNTTD